MFRKILRDFFLLFGLAAFVVSTNREIMGYLSQVRDTNKWWGDYQNHNGDLVAMSYLDIPKFRLNHDIVFKRHPKNDSTGVALYLFGDSNTRFLRDTAFTSICSYLYIPRSGKPTHYQLDPAKKNILVIEIAERYFREYFSGLDIYKELSGTAAKPISLSSKQPDNYVTAHAVPQLAGLDADIFFNKYINQNLQFNLFNYNFVIPMFASKAALNYELFNGASGDVVISNDKQFLFLKETVVNDGIHSSYSKVTHEQITNCINNMNIIYDHYRAEGFREVYFSIIPSTATIMQPGGYNNLIPLMQADPRNKMKLIDIYSILKKPDGKYFNPGDTHWNNAGIQQWLKIVNDTLDRWTKKKTDL